MNLYLVLLVHSRISHLTFQRLNRCLSQVNGAVAAFGFWWSEMVLYCQISSDADPPISCVYALPRQRANPDTNKQDFVRYRVSGNSIVEGTPTKAKKFEPLYIRNRFQANERALRECKRLIYSRMTMSVTAMAAGEWVNIGDMVQVPDTYDTNQQAGYIVSRSGNNFETSERINFSGQMFVQITDALGATTARYPATPRGDTDFGFTAAVPDIELNLFDGFSV